MTALSDLREYDHQFTTFKTTLSISDLTLRVLINTSEVTVELSTKFDLTSAEQLTFADDQSDDADLSDHLINMSK